MQQELHGTEGEGEGVPMDDRGRLLQLEEECRRDGTEDSQSAVIQDLQHGQYSQSAAIQDLQRGQDSQSAAIQDLQNRQDSLCLKMDRMETQSRDPTPSLPPVIIAGNIVTEGSIVNVSVAVGAEQGNEGDPHLSQSLRANLSYYYSKECIQDNPLLVSSTMQLVKLNLVQPEQRQPQAERVHQATPMHLARGGIERVPHEKVPLDYENILSFTPPSGISRKRVLIEGVAGSGKSTLVQRMCHDWSVGQFAHDYELVVQVNLRKLPKDHKLSLEDLICTSVEDEDIVKEMVQFIATHKGEKVLFIFDGYDEMSKEMQNNSLVHSILRGLSAPLSSFVVTSRPISAEGLYYRVDRRVEICGFGEEEVKDYVRKYFASEPSARDKLLSTLSFGHFIAKLCYIPLYLLIICHAVAFGGNSPELPRTLHALFERLIILTVNHNLEREGRKERANSLQDVSRFCPSFNKLAQLALEGIENDTFIFSDLNNFEVDSALHGVFNSIAARNQNGIITCMWHFTHLTLQEFMAALAVVMKTPGEQVTFWKQHLILKYNKEGDFVLADDHYRTVFLFYCGLSNLSIPGIQSMLLDTIDGSTCVKPTISQGTTLSEMCEAIAESGDEHLARSILSSCGSAVEIDEHCLGNIGVAWCISQYFKQIDGAGIRVRGEEAARGDSAISIPMSALARFVTQQKDVSTLTRVEIKDLQFDDSNTDLQTVRQYLLQQAQLKCFTFEVQGSGAKHLTDSKDLVDTKDPIKTADVIDALKDVLTHHRESLEELALGFREDATSDHLNPLMMSVATCERLTSLKLKHVTLSTENLVVVVKALPNLRALKLKSVYLSDENKTTTSVISSSVKEHPSLKEMTVEMPRAQDSDSLVIGAVQGMAARCGMEKLALVLYPTLYDQLTLLILRVLMAGSLKKLRLGVELNPFYPKGPSKDPATSLSLLIVQLLLPQLQYCTELRELKVEMIDTVQMWSSNNVRLLPPAIEENIAKSTKLQKLTVRGTVKWKVLAPVSAAFLNVATRIKALEEVTLKWCAFGGIDESVLEFADHMKNSQLRRVEMSYCESLLPFHIATICRSLQQLNTLEELTVSSDSMMKQEDTGVRVEDVSDPEVLQSVEDAVRVNRSVTVIRIHCTELRWTNIVAAILKGTLNNVSLRELDLATPENFPPTLPFIVKDVRRAKPMLRLVLRAGYNHYL